MRLTDDDIRLAWQYRYCSESLENGQYFVPYELMTYCDANTLRTYYLLMEQAALTGDAP